MSKLEIALKFGKSNSVNMYPFDHEHELTEREACCYFYVQARRNRGQILPHYPRPHFVRSRTNSFYRVDVNQLLVSADKMLLTHKQEIG